MRPFRYYSLELRKQLILLILIIFIPVMAILIFTGYQQYERTLKDMEGNANQLIHRFVEDQRDIVNQTRELLNIISRVPAVRELDLAPCNAFLGDILKDNPQYSTIVAASSEGIIDCCAIPLQQPIDVRDRSWFQRAKESKQFVIDNFLISRSSHKASLPFAFPILDDYGRIMSIVGAAYDLDYYGNVFRKNILPSNSVIFVTDRNNIVLYQSVSKDEYIGRSLSECRGFNLPDSNKGSFTVRDIDGIKRLFWFQRLSVGQESNKIAIMVGVPEHTIYSDARRMLAMTVSLLIALGSLCFAMAWIFGKKCILDPVNLLVEKTRSVQQGDLSPSNAVDLLPGELRVLARAFDDMLSNLGRREAERDDALDALRREVIQHKETVDVLREREEHLRILFEQAADAIYVSRPDGCLIKVNQQACRMLGYTEDELLRLKVIDVDAQISTAEAFRETSESLSYGQPITVESTHRRKDGSIFPVEITVALLQTQVGPHMIGIVRDITHRKQAEEEQEKLQAQLLQAQKMEAVGRLAGGVAHDFNNMLSIIIGHAEMLLDGIPPGDPSYYDVMEMKKAAQRSADLTRQLLAFARKQTISPEILDLNESASGILKMLQRLIGEDINLVWIPAPGIWPVKMDPGQIDQILANLAVNARDAIAKGGTMTIETANVAFDEDYCRTHQSFVPGDYVMLAVSDNGTGMEKETVERIFEPFFTTKEMGKGTGLGLATVYGIVRQNNGLIDVYSEHGHGTTFKIYLPRAERRTEERPAHIAKKELTGTETVFLVEDEESILALGKSILERRGYTVLATQSPAEALRMARSHTGPVHLLITDVVMPEMNGKDLRDEFEAIKPGFKCIFMSGYTANVIAHHGILDEGVDFLQKPFTIKTLTEKVRQILDG